MLWYHQGFRWISYGVTGGRWRFEGQQPRIKSGISGSWGSQHKIGKVLAQSEFCERHGLHPPANKSQSRQVCTKSPFRDRFEQYPVSPWPSGSKFG